MPPRIRSDRTSLSNCAKAASTPSISLPVEVSSIGSVADRNRPGNREATEPILFVAIAGRPSSPHIVVRGRDMLHQRANSGSNTMRRRVRVACAKRITLDLRTAARGRLDSPAQTALRQRPSLSFPALAGPTDQRSKRATMVIIQGTKPLTRASPSPILPVDRPFDTSKDLYIGHARARSSKRITSHASSRV